MRWLLLVRRMEFELYVGMGAEKKVQFYAICIAITAFCAFLIFMNLLFGTFRTRPKYGVDVVVSTDADTRCYTL